MTAEKLKSILQANLSEVCLYGNDSIYFYGDIPFHCAHGAIDHYALNVDYRDIVALVDTTLLSDGARGLVFTLEGMYVKQKGYQAQYYPYRTTNELNMTELRFSISRLAALFQKIKAEIEEDEFLQELKSGATQFLKETFFSAASNIVSTAVNDAVEAINAPSTGPLMQHYAALLDKKIEELEANPRQARVLNEAKLNKLQISYLDETLIVFLTAIFREINNDIAQGNDPWTKQEQDAVVFNAILLFQRELLSANFKQTDIEFLRLTELLESPKKRNVLKRKAFRLTR